MNRPNAESIFHEARDLPPDQRDAYLKGACAHDAALRAKVDALLAADEEAGAFMRRVEADATIRTPGREEPGQVIDRYKLLQPIGEGGFGSVWMAEQREPVKRRVALKIIKLGMDTKQVIARFEAERQALAMMDHPNIAKVLDAGATETGRPYFVMEYIKGVPILDYCDTEKLDTRTRLDLFMKVCHAIQHAHTKGIIHRDIKPTNILITMHDGEPVPKVIDFGIAKATSTELTTRTLFTEHRQMIGTPAYMSPEQAEMSGLDIDTRSDVYSLGVLLYELLTGTTPFENNSLMEAGFAEMMRIIREEEPHKPSTRLSSLGVTATRTAEQRRADVKRLNLLLRGDLDWIVMKCLEKDRTRRYETATGLAEDVRRHLDDEPVSAGPPSAAYKLRKFVRRNRGPVIAASTVAVLLVIGFISLSVLYQWAMTERARVLEQSATAAAAIGESNDIIIDALDDLAAEYGDVAPRELPINADETFEGMEVDALGIASRNLAIFLSRSLKEEAASRRAAERVAEFQEAQLGDVDVQQMGIGLRRDLLAAAGDNDAARRAIDEVNYIDLARATLERNILAQTLQAVESQFADDPIVKAQLLHALANTADRLGLREFAEAPMTSAYEIRLDVLGEGHPDTLASMNALANLMNNKGAYDEAEALVLACIDAATRHLGEDQEQHIIAVELLGLIYQSRNMHDESINLHLDVLDWRQSRRGELDQSTLHSLHNLASAYSESGRFEEADRMLIDILDKRRRTVGEEHRDTIAAMGNLARHRMRVGRFNEAEEIFDEAVDIARRAHGEDHPITLSMNMNLAGLYNQQRRYDDSEALLIALLQTMRRVIGPASPITLNAVGSLSQIYIMTARFEDAYDLLVEPVGYARRSRGDDDQLSIQLGMFLITACQATRRMDEMEQLILELCRPEHVHHNNTMILRLDGLAQTYAAQQRFDEEARMRERALESRRRVLGDALSPLLLTPLADVYMTLERYDDAESLYAEAAQMLDDATARPDHIIMIDRRHADALRALDRLDDAERRLLHAVEIARLEHGDDDPQTCALLAELGALYIDMHRDEDACEALEAALLAKRRLFAAPPPFTDDALRSLADAYHRRGMVDAALDAHTRRLEAQVAAANRRGADASTIHTAASALLRHDVESLRDPERALPLAERASKDAGADLWRHLDTLALAQHLTGDTAAAAQTQRRALDLMPAGADPGVAQRLADYEALLDD